MTAFFRIGILVILVGSSFLASSEYRLVVSASALAEFETYAPFFQSRIFFSDPSLLTITNANPSAFATENVLFFSPEGVEAKEIVSAHDEKTKGTFTGILGSSYRGVVISGELSEHVKRDLGADSTRFAYETRRVNNKTIFAFSRDGDGPVIWPNKIEELLPTPAVIIKDNKTNAAAVVFGRLIGDVSHRLGLIDKILRSKEIRTDFIELGTNHDVLRPLSDEYAAALAKRRPSVVMAGTFEMESMVSKNEKLKNLPMVYPFGNRFHVPAARAGQKNEQVHFWSVTGNEKLWPRYGSLGERVQISGAIEAMKTAFADPNQALNVVRVFSDDAAREMARSPYVDLVLLLAKDPFDQLASRELIEIKQSTSDSVEPVSPIVKVSYLDVTEVLIKGKTLNNVQSVEVRRHSINDTVERATDIINVKLVQNEKGLQALSSVVSGANQWTAPTLQKTLGAIMLKEGKADVAIVEALRPMTPIEGPVPRDMAISLLSPEGAMATITTTGKQLKKIVQAINKSEGGRRYFIFGIDDRGGKIGQRTTNDNERFTVALSESALFDLFGFSRLGGLNEEYSIRAPFVESIYGDITGLYFVGGPKVMAISDTVSGIEDAVNDIRARELLRTVVARSLLSLDNEMIQYAIAYPQGKPHPVLTFDISYFDFGFSKNFANSLYREQLKLKQFPNSRSKVEPFVHLFIFAKTALNYDAPKINLALTGEVKFMQTDVDKKPEKDKTKIGITARLPWEKDLMKDYTVVVSPLIKSLYETKLVPSFWSTPKDDKGKELVLQRPRLLNTLLGVNLNFTKLGFNADIGGVLSTDFNRVRPIDAFDVGPGMNFFSKWPLFGPLELSSDIQACYLFALPGNTASNKLALFVEGTVWLRVARFHNFSVSVLSDFMIASLQQDPGSISMSSIFGITLSYGRLFRLFG